MAGKSRTGTLTLSSNYISGGGGSHGGGGTSRGTSIITTPNIDYARAVNNQLASAAANAVAQQVAQNQATPQVYIHTNDSSIANASPATLTQNGNTKGNGGTANATYSQAVATPTVSDPYASIYSLYENQLNAQRDALNQQRAARQNALQASYNNAKSQLDSSFNQGETEMNQSADKALREAYINKMLSEKSLSQSLANQGVTGGAAESILARLFNNYGNSRNEIEQGRMDNLRQLLANYQGTLGDIENSYLAGMADADSDYSGSIANALQSYYGNLADLQKQNIANQYKAALSKSGSAKSATEDTGLGLNKDIVNGLKNHKGNLAAARAYLSYMGVPETEQDSYLWNAGYDLTPEAQAQAQAETYKNALKGISDATRNTIINNLKRIYPTSAQDGLSQNDSLYKNVIEQLNKYARQYGLTDAQAQALLAEAGF